MPSKASLITNLERSRLVIGLLVIIILVMSFLLAWKSVEREATDTAFLVASKRVIEQAGYYKQQWLLAGQKQPLELDGKLITYTASGWVLPVNAQKQKDCAFLLDALYPEKEVLGSFPVAINSEFIGSSYRCTYLYSQERFISIDLINNKFSANVGTFAN